MKRIVCNRCGKLLMEKGKDGYGYLNVTCYSPRDTHGFLKFFLGYEEDCIQIDLCEDCTRELKEWLDGNGWR